MNNFIIRKATELDAEAIALVHIQSWQKAYDLYIPESILNNLSVSECTQQWYELIKKGVTIFALEINNQLIGFASICAFRDAGKDDFQGEISAIYLLPDYWRKGFGAKLCEAALNELSKIGYKEALLWVLADNHQARIFYENLGFFPEDKTKLEEFYDGGALLTEVLYKKKI